MSGPRLGALSNNRWSGGISMKTLFRALYDGFSCWNISKEKNRASNERVYNLKKKKKKELLPENKAQSTKHSSENTAFFRRAFLNLGQLQYVWCSWKRFSCYWISTTIQLSSSHKGQARNRIVSRSTDFFISTDWWLSWKCLAFQMCITRDTCKSTEHERVRLWSWMGSRDEVKDRPELHGRSSLYFDLRVKCSLSIQP
jgi:hypothetical protein